MLKTNQQTNQPNDQPVTVDVLQQIKPNCEAAFEQVLTDLIHAAEAFEGHLGVSVFRSSNHANSEYRIIFKFDRLSHLRQWEDSPVRHRLLERANRLTVNSGQFQILTGLESWFTLSTQGAITPPPRYKMLLVSLLVIFPLINLLNLGLQPLLGSLPPLLRSLIVTVITLFLTTYVVMPRITKLFSAWLYPKPKA